jgi:hypothetical protein
MFFTINTMMSNTIKQLAYLKMIKKYYKQTLKD